MSLRTAPLDTSVLCERDDRHAASLTSLAELAPHSAVSVAKRL